jgi:hypothetical protein
MAQDDTAAWTLYRLLLPEPAAVGPASARALLGANSVRASLLSTVVVIGLSLAVACGGSSSATKSDDHADAGANGSPEGGASGSSQSGASGTGQSGTAGVPLDCGIGNCPIGGICYSNLASNVPKGDGCNSCSCRDGVASCTNEPCNTQGAACVSANREYPSGSLVPLDCNSCLCIDGELRNCTTEPCPTRLPRCRGTGQDCTLDEVCVAPDCGGDGICVRRRGDCPTLGDSVCDCFGITHQSICSAQQLATAVAHAGACEERSCSLDGVVKATGSTWEVGDGCNYCQCTDGTIACSHRSCIPCDDNLDCDQDEYCSFGYGTCGADGPGICQLRPRGNCLIEAGPACGCDGNLYMNYCGAAKAGVSLDECATGG